MPEAFVAQLENGTTALVAINVPTINRTKTRLKNLLLKIIFGILLRPGLMRLAE
ncbi:MAG: hypothetical protein JNJ50_23010 [Acidobacteria bacterium]|nr:hypothetical protein [Acidobacteriota bacterium]